MKLAHGIMPLPNAPLPPAAKPLDHDRVDPRSDVLLANLRHRALRIAGIAWPSISTPANAIETAEDLETACALESPALAITSISETIFSFEEGA